MVTICSLMALCLKTPEHDGMRSIQAAMAKSSTTKSAELVQQELAVHNKLKYGVVALWCTMYSLYGLVNSGSVTHISLYFSEYLGKSSGMARYLISMYSAGQLAHRVMLGFTPKSLKERIETTGFMMGCLLAMLLIMACLTAIWLFMPFEMKFHTLYVVFPALGFANSALAPYVVALIDSVTPVSGTISCILMMMLGAGDLLIVFVNGELIQKYGAMIQPAAICVYCLLMVPALILTIVLHRRYKRIQKAIISYDCTPNELEYLSPRLLREDSVSTSEDTVTVDIIENFDDEETEMDSNTTCRLMEGQYSTSVSTSGSCKLIDTASMDTVSTFSSVDTVSGDIDVCV